MSYSAEKYQALVAKAHLSNPKSSGRFGRKMNQYNVLRGKAFLTLQ